jgi:hypothetical protein
MSRVSPDEPSEKLLVDFPRLAARLRVAVVVLGILALAGAVGEGLISGLTFAVLIRWGSGFLAALLVSSAVLTALSAYRGADTAQRRGERLSGEDVGLVPPRRRPPE